MEFTQTFYDYIDRLDRNLGPVYNNFGISLRMPMQFREIPAPRPQPPQPQGSTEGEQPAEEQEQPRDPRQPEFLLQDLPGLIAAWQAEMMIVNPDGSAGSATGYAYLLSNYEAWQRFKTADELGDPLEFHEDVMDILTDELQVEIDDRVPGSATDRINKWFNEVVPDEKYSEFVSRKSFTTITLVPDQTADEDDDFLGEERPPLDRQISVYLYQNGDMKIALVFALPNNVSAGEEIENRTIYCLQTIEVSDQKPTPRGARPAANGTPQTPAENSPPAGNQNSGPRF